MSDSKQKEQECDCKEGWGIKDLFQTVFGLASLAVVIAAICVAFEGIEQKSVSGKTTDGREISLATLKVSEIFNKESFSVGDRSYEAWSVFDNDAHLAMPTNDYSSYVEFKKQLSPVK